MCKRVNLLQGQATERRNQQRREITNGEQILTDQQTEPQTCHVPLEDRQVMVQNLWNELQLDQNQQALLQSLNTYQANLWLEGDFYTNFAYQINEFLQTANEQTPQLKLAVLDVAICLLADAKNVVEEAAISKISSQLTQLINYLTTNGSSNGTPHITNLDAIANQDTCEQQLEIRLRHLGEIIPLLLKNGTFNQETCQTLIEQMTTLHTSAMNQVDSLLEQARENSPDGEDQVSTADPAAIAAYHALALAALHITIQLATKPPNQSSDLFQWILGQTSLLCQNSPNLVSIPFLEHLGEYISSLPPGTFNPDICQAFIGQMQVLGHLAMDQANDLVREQADPTAIGACRTLALTALNVTAQLVSATGVIPEDICEPIQNLITRVAATDLNFGENELLIRALAQFGGHIQSLQLPPETCTNLVKLAANALNHKGEEDPVQHQDLSHAAISVICSLFLKLCGNPQGETIQLEAMEALRSEAPQNIANAPANTLWQCIKNVQPEPALAFALLQYIKSGGDEGSLFAQTIDALFGQIGNDPEFNQESDVGKILGYYDQCVDTNQGPITATQGLFNQALGLNGGTFNPAVAAAAFGVLCELAGKVGESWPIEQAWGGAMRQLQNSQNPEQAAALAELARECIGRIPDGFQGYFGQDGLIGQTQGLFNQALGWNEEQEQYTLENSTPVVAAAAFGVLRALGEKVDDFSLAAANIANALVGAKDALLGTLSEALANPTQQANQQVVASIASIVEQFAEIIPCAVASESINSQGLQDLMQGLFDNIFPDGNQPSKELSPAQRDIAFSALSIWRLLLVTAQPRTGGLYAEMSNYAHENGMDHFSCLPDVWWRILHKDLVEGSKELQNALVATHLAPHLAILDKSVQEVISCKVLPTSFGKEDGKSQGACDSLFEVEVKFASLKPPKGRRKSTAAPQENTTETVWIIAEMQQVKSNMPKRLIDYAGKTIKAYIKTCNEAGTTPEKRLVYAVAYECGENLGTVAPESPRNLSIKTATVGIGEGSDVGRMLSTVRNVATLDFKLKDNKAFDGIVVFAASKLFKRNGLGADANVTAPDGTAVNLSDNAKIILDSLTTSPSNIEMGLKRISDTQSYGLLKDFSVDHADKVAKGKAEMDEMWKSFSGRSQALLGYFYGRDVSLEKRNAQLQYLATDTQKKLVAAEKSFKEQLAAAEAERDAERAQNAETISQLSGVANTIIDTPDARDRARKNPSYRQLQDKGLISQTPKTNPQMDASEQAQLQSVIQMPPAHSVSSRSQVSFAGHNEIPKPDIPTEEAQSEEFQSGDGKWTRSPTNPDTVYSPRTGKAYYSGSRQPPPPVTQASAAGRSLTPQQQAVSDLISSIRSDASLQGVITSHFSFNGTLALLMGVEGHLGELAKHVKVVVGWITSLLEHPDIGEYPSLRDKLGETLQLLQHQS